MDRDKIEAPEAIEGGATVTANGAHPLASTKWPGADPTVGRTADPDE